ncbi:MAG: nucleotidase [Frankiales bacterium]|jgi:hypothetical protein|nr:nucleotidase [Frankiales bacterium]
MRTGVTRLVAVFDIDGVLADVRHRVHHVEGRRRDWTAFFAAAPYDTPLAEGVALAVESAKECDVLYVTGRPEQCRTATLQWFERHGLPPGELCMRSARDRRPARVAKPEMLARALRGRIVALVVDDDEQVCRAYEQAGFRVLRATWMGASPALERAQEQDGRT